MSHDRRLGFFVSPDPQAESSYEPALWAEERGYDLNKISGTVQADILKEYMAQKEYIFPIAPSVRIVRDVISYSTKTMKR